MTSSIRYSTAATAAVATLGLLLAPAAAQAAPTDGAGVTAKKQTKKAAKKQAKKLRPISATIATRKNNTITVNVNPNSAKTNFRVALQQKRGKGWKTVKRMSTRGANETVSFPMRQRGTYRAVVVKTGKYDSTTTSRVRLNKSLKSLRSVQLNAQRKKVVAVARQQLGKGYVYGATGPNVFDCSGLTSHVYRQALGKNLPRTAASQYYSGSAKARFGHGRGTPVAGDIIYFGNGGEHVGIYVGGGKMIHAANPGTGVEMTRYNMGWYSRTITGYARYIG